MAEKDSENEQMQFYEKVADYIGRHPEFVEELRKRMEEDEKIYSKKEKYGSRKEKESKETEKTNEANEIKETKSKKGFLKLDEERINTISDELSGLLFDKDKYNKSVLEKTVQDAFSNIVKNYLSEYAK